MGPAGVIEHEHRVSRIGRGENRFNPIPETSECQLGERAGIWWRIHVACTCHHSTAITAAARCSEGELSEVAKHNPLEISPEA